MTLDPSTIRTRLRAGDLRPLFIEELGWDNFRGGHKIAIGPDTYALTGIAEKRGAQVFLCSPGTDGKIPERDVRAKIDTQLRKLAHEHLIIFVNAGTPPSEQLWQWVQSDPGKPRAIREHRFHTSQPGESLIQKLLLIRFEIGEEEELTLAGTVLRRVTEAFGRRDKVTKRFFDGFQREHKRFLGFIEGIQAQGDREWYASVMLNRLMFIYFIQQKRFLNNDPRYLRTKLEEVPRKLGKDKFHSFYRDFLRRLFHEGLAHQQPRTTEVDALIGDVPYLNGGIFDTHQLERENADIDIPDAAFEGIFAFFESYEWTLDTRELRKDNEINPDVLGYIFEKYINQKQMGAYYTKEDITGYISKNTVLPFLLDATKDGCKVAFGPNGPAWRLPQDDPDRYIYDAVRKGVDEPLPAEVEAGIADVSKRGGWNKPASAEFALPTETWREHVARRTRCLGLRAKLAAGEVSEVNDLITYNLDIRQFAQDVIERSEGPDVVRSFYKAIAEVSVLDPTCGSGAFLFAALNILEPLYEACLDRMQAWLDDEEQLGRMHPGHDFRKWLGVVASHPNREYFVLKSIIINNLYGVDIMEEAVEICKLRLFLKLVAQVHDARHIEPLPDIDFNIKAGNTLVGFTSLDAVQQAMTAMPNGQARMKSAEDEAELSRIEEDALVVDKAYRNFRDQQTTYGGAVTDDAKRDLRQRLEQLDARLDQHLARQYGLDPANTAALEKWRASHQPFHWFVEFYGIMSKGGFDAIIGNPPYVEYRNVRDQYSVIGYSTQPCGDLYAFVEERALSLSQPHAGTGMILPVSIVSTDGFGTLRALLREKQRQHWASSFAERPSKLFTGVDKRLTIWLSRNTGTEARMFTERYARWLGEERPTLLDQLAFAEEGESFARVGTAVAKIHSSVEEAILRKLSGQSALSAQMPSSSAHTVLYTRKLRYFIQFFDFTPRITNERGVRVDPTELKALTFRSALDARVALAALNSSAFFWFFNCFSDVRNVNRREIDAFPLDLGTIDRGLAERLSQLSRELMEDFRAHSRDLSISYGTRGSLTIQSFQPRESKRIIDEIDRVLAKHYGFTDEELDFIINYDIKYRMGADSSDDGDSD